MNNAVCHSCGAVTESQCRSCEQAVCENCTVPFTIMNQIDYTLCNNCHDSYEEERAEELYEESLSPQEFKKYRREKNIVSGLLKSIKKMFG